MFDRSKECFIFGVILSKGGIRPDPEKVECLAKADPPTTVSELKSFLGYESFYPDLFTNNYTTT